MTTQTETAHELARYIQHTLIGQEVTREILTAHCQECLRYGFDAAMVQGSWVALASEILHGSTVKVASAVDFPLGIMSTAGKVAEASALVAAGAVQLDIGVQIGWLKSGLYDAFRDDIAAVVSAVAPVPVKVMLELPLLNPEQRERAVDLAVEAGVAYVKNASSGKIGPATPEWMQFLRQRVPASVRVKASGGINSAAQVRALLAAGADLVGTSSGVAIVTSAEAALSGY